MRKVKINKELDEIVTQLCILYEDELNWRRKDVVSFSKSGVRSCFYKKKPSYYQDEEWLINRFVSILWRITEIELPLLTKALALSSCEVANRE